MKTTRLKLSVPTLPLIAATALVATGCSVVGIRTTEEASYELLRADGDFELREYDELVVVETVVDADYDEAGDVAFRRLFGYISGDNASASSIAMTAPVLADAAGPAASEDGQRIAMTSPVLGERGEDGWRYAFVLPASIAWDRAPAPTDPDVGLERVPPSRVAALRYTGFWSDDRLREKAAELRAWIEANGLTPVSAPRSAAYDPPWTIPFLRRNEVLIDVE